MHQSFLLQRQQRLAHRALAALEALRQLELEQGDPGRDLAQHDHALEAVEDLRALAGPHAVLRDGEHLRP